MGEQVHSFTSGHTWFPIMRSSRGKLFVYIAVLGGMCFVVFLLSSVHSNLKQMENVNEKCQQQRDSLSAQLQVVYEHKNRLEKSLQQEKSDHRHTKEEHERQQQEQENKLQQEKDKRQALESQLSQLKASYSELEVDKKHAESLIKDQLQAMQAQKDKEIKKLQAHISELLAEKDKLEQAHSALAWKIEQHSNEANLCRLQQEQLQQQLRRCSEQLQKVPPEGIGTQQGVNKPVDTGNVKPPGSHLTSKPTLSSGNPKEKANVLPRPNIQLPDEQSPGVSEKIQHPAKNSSDSPSVNQPSPPLLNNAADTDVKKNSVLNNEIENNEINNNNNNEARDLNNAVYQFPPPDSQGAERGEFGNALQAQQQVENPMFKDTNLDARLQEMKKSNVLAPPPDNYAAQARYMLDNSPDVNDIANRKDGPGHLLQNDMAADRINRFRANAGILKQGHELPDMDDKQQYPDEEDDDQDGGDDENPVGGGQGNQERPMNEHDFEDQESKDNIKPEEGIMLSPK